MANCSYPAFEVCCPAQGPPQALADVSWLGLLGTLLSKEETRLNNQWSCLLRQLRDMKECSSKKRQSPFALEPSISTSLRAFIRASVMSRMVPSL